MEQKKPNTTVITVGVLALVLAIAGGVSLLNKQETTETADAESNDGSRQTTASSSAQSTPTSSATTTAASTAPATASTAANTYKNGTYSASGTYSTPGGAESINVTLTIKDGVVTDSSVSQSTTNRESQEFFNSFAASYKGKVVGQKLESLSLSRVSGSSLTPRGFNSALASIKSKAKS